MAKRATTQEFINRARAVHGDKYGYTFSIYLGNHIKVMIYCHEHGIFSMTPANHNSGHGCPACAGKKKHDNKSFIEKSRERHGDKYDYSLVHYVNAKTKIKINCHEHGAFEQTPFNHLSGRGCPKCADKIRADAKRYDTDSFIAKAHAVHGNIYGYGKVKYTDSISKVIIVCSEHGDFEQTANAHISGQGCPGCAKYGFDRTRSASLYVLRSDCGQYMKIGITNKPNQREAQLSRATPFSFKRIELIKGPGEQIANLEKELLAEYQPAEFTETFDGYSEWRLWDDSIRHKLLVSKIQG